MGKFDGKVAIVTGASGGIGRASALAFAGHGASVIVADINDEGGNETVALIDKAGGRATYVHTDVSIAAEVEAMVVAATRTYGRLDFAHNNAGVPRPSTPLAEYSEQDWALGLAVMLTGPFLCMKYEIPVMLSNGGGAIVNTASGAGLVAFPGQCSYVAAKHGLIGLTKTAALDYGAKGIRINAICPGTARSPMVDDAIAASPELEDHLRSLHPIGRIGTAEEIAAGAIWLCSDESSFVLGHALSIDGGYVLA